MKRFYVSVIIFCLSAAITQAKHLNPEKYYQNKWCTSQKGTQEIILKDLTRVDCITSTHAIEFDFANKWAEAIGQSLHYAEMTNKQAGIVLIIEKPAQWKYYNILLPLCQKYNITLWTIQ